METQIQELYKPLFLYVRKRISNKEDAEDLTQEVFYKLAKSENDTISNIKSWVYTIAKNTITDYYRKKKIYTEEIEDKLDSEEYSDENVVEELSCCIDAYIDQLPEDYKQVMWMSEMEEIPQKDIASKLDMNYVTVRSKVQRGRKKIKNMFLDCCTVIQGGRGSIMEYHEKCNNKGKSC